MKETRRTDLFGAMIYTQPISNGMHSIFEGDYAVLETLLAFDAWSLRGPRILTDTLHSSLGTFDTFLAIRVRDAALLSSSAFRTAMGAFSHPLTGCFVGENAW